MAFEDVYAEVVSASSVKGFADEVTSEYGTVLRQLLPPGPAWNIDRDGDFQKLLTGMGHSYERVVLRGKDLLREYNPATMFELLPDWERVLSLPGTNPSPPTTLDARRGAVQGKMLGHGDPNVQSFIDIAAGVGYTVILKHKEYAPFVPGSPVGDPLSNHEWKFFWVVIHATLDDDALVEWMLQQVAPDHTVLQVVALGADWVERENAQAPINKDLYHVASDGAGLWVAVGIKLTSPTQAYIVTSQDGVSWTAQANPKNLTLLGVAHNGSDLWVAVGEADGTDAYILTSANGYSWDEQTNPITEWLSAVAHDGSGLWCAVGNPDGTDSAIVTSPDGVTWLERSNPKSQFMTAVAHNQLDLWVAVGNADGTDAYIITSANGITWAEQTNSKNGSLHGVAFKNGLWVAVGDFAGAAYILTSTNGVDWDEQTPPAGSVKLNAITHEQTELGGLWIAVGEPVGGKAYILTSVDGIDWVEQSNPKSFSLRSIAYYNGQLVACGVADGTDAYLLTSG